jgi:hypothetical protein
MSKDTCKKPLRIAREDLAKVAAEGVARAIEARKAAGVELSPDELNAVSGAIFNPGIIHGGFPPGPALNGLSGALNSAY